MASSFRSVRGDGDEAVGSGGGVGGDAPLSPVESMEPRGHRSVRLDQTGSIYIGGTVLLMLMALVVGPWGFHLYNSTRTSPPYRGVPGGSLLLFFDRPGVSANLLVTVDSAASPAPSISVRLSVNSMEERVETRWALAGLGDWEYQASRGATRRSSISSALPPWGKTGSVVTGTISAVGQVSTSADVAHNLAEVTKGLHEEVFGLDLPDEGEVVFYGQLPKPVSVRSTGYEVGTLPPVGVGQTGTTISGEGGTWGPPDGLNVSLEVALDFAGVQRIESANPSTSEGNELIWRSRTTLSDTRWVITNVEERERAADRIFLAGLLVSFGFGAFIAAVQLLVAHRWRRQP